MVIGVSGQSGAGKSVFCDFLSKRGCLILDCDRIYHTLVDAPSPCTAALAEEEMFGERVLRPDGSLDRSIMASIVFAKDGGDKLKRLNEITHAFVLNEVRERIRSAPPAVPAVVVDAPLLFQSGFDRECDMTVALIAPPEMRLERLRLRDGKTDAELQARLDAAPPDSYYIERATVTLHNRGDLSELESACEDLVSRIFSNKQN